MSTGNDVFGSEEARAAMAAELARAVEKFDAGARGKLLARAAAEGWSPAQAEWIDVVSRASLLQAVAAGTPHEEALDGAYRSGRRQLTIGYFDGAIERGENRMKAFLALVELEKQLAIRRGEPPPSYPDDIVAEACRAIAQAAEDGLSSDDQFDLGFYVIRRRVGESTS